MSKCNCLDNLESGNCHHCGEPTSFGPESGDHWVCVDCVLDFACLHCMIGDSCETDSGICADCAADGVSGERAERGFNKRLAKLRETA